MEYFENIVGLIEFSNEPIAFGNNKYVQTNDLKCYIIDEYIFGTRPFIQFHDYILYQLEEFGEIYIINNSLILTKTINEGFNLYALQLKFYQGKLLLPNRNTRSYWSLDCNLELTDLKYLQNLPYSGNDKFYHYYDGIFKCFSFLQNEPDWIVDLKDISINNKTNINQQDDKNSLHLKSGIFGYPIYWKTLFIIPLENYSLIAIDSNSGKFVWLFEPNDLAYNYVLVNDEIWTYKQGSLLKINPGTGEIEKEYNITSILKKHNFNPLLPIRVTEDTIILTHHIKGEVLLLTKTDMKVFDFIKMEYRFPVSEDTIKKIGNSLFIHNSNENILMVKKYDCQQDAIPNKSNIVG